MTSSIPVTKVLAAYISLLTILLTLFVTNRIFKPIDCKVIDESVTFRHFNSLNLD